MEWKKKVLVLTPKTLAINDVDYDSSLLYIPSDVMADSVPRLHSLEGLFLANV